MTGWIKLSREIMDHWIFQDAEYFRAWVMMLMMANHDGKTVLVNNTPVKLKRGSFYSSILSLSGQLKWDRKRTTRFIDMLEAEELVTTERTTNGTTFCIVNYSKFQDEWATDGTTVGTTLGTTVGTTLGTTSGTETRMIKNDKNEKNNNMSVRHRHGTHQNVLLTEEEYKKLQEEFPDDYESRIDDLSYYMKSKGKTYKDHSATIRNWDRMQKKRDAATPHRLTPEEEQKRAWEAFLERHKDEPDGEHYD